MNFDKYEDTGTFEFEPIDFGRELSPVEKYAGSREARIEEALRLAIHTMEDLRTHHMFQCWARKRPVQNSTTLRLLGDALSTIRGLTK